jgi:predicted transcriptional regulator
MKQRLYRSRNEAIRAILAEGLEARLSEDEDVTAIVSKLLSMKKHGKNPVSFKSKRSVIELIAEGRD